MSLSSIGLSRAALPKALVALRSGACWTAALVTVGLGGCLGGLGGCLGSSDPADQRSAAPPDTSHRVAVLTVHESAVALPVAIPAPDTSGVYIMVAPDSGIARTDSLFHFDIAVHNNSTEPVVLFGLRDDGGYSGVREWEEGQGVCRSDRIGVSYVLFDAHGEEYTRTMSLGDNDIGFYRGLFGGADPDSLLEAQVDRLTREYDEERAAPPPPVAWNDRVVVAPGSVHTESWALQVAVGYGLGGESAPYSFVVYYRMGEEATERGEEDALLGCYVANPIRLRVDSSWDG